MLETPVLPNKYGFILEELNGASGRSDVYSRPFYPMSITPSSRVMENIITASYCPMQEYMVLNATKNMGALSCESRLAVYSTPIRIVTVKYDIKVRQQCLDAGGNANALS